MRPQKVDDQQLIAGLMAVLRAKGFDGASLNDLSEATGLKKASLYHRFPGGKKEITEAVLKYVQQWNQAHIYDVLVDDKLTPENRLDSVLLSIRQLYNDGDSICILRAMSTDTGIPLFGIQIKESFQMWLDGFTALGMALGHHKKKSQQMAREVLIRIQGALILSKGLDDLSPFQESLSGIKKMYS